MEFRLLTAEEIDVRPATVNEKGVTLLLYKDARCDMNILDETLGCEYWQRSHEIIDGNLYCNVGIYNKELGCWIWKQDVGTESFTEKEKGKASDSFKRACFNLGIGRELYTAPFIWVKASELKSHFESGKDNYGKPRFSTYDTFSVVDIQYIDRKICYVKIKDNSNGKEFEFGTPTEFKKKEEEVAKKTISKVKANALKKQLENDNVSIEKVCEHYKVDSLEKLTEKQHAHLIANYEVAKEKLANAN